jgi:hypothetical protein
MGISKFVSEKITQVKEALMYVPSLIMEHINALRNSVRTQVFDLLGFGDKEKGEEQSDKSSKKSMEASEGNDDADNDTSEKRDEKSENSSTTVDIDVEAVMKENDSFRTLQSKRLADATNRYRKAELVILKEDNSSQVDTLFSNHYELAHSADLDKSAQLSADWLSQMSAEDIDAKEHSFADPNNPEGGDTSVKQRMEKCGVSIRGQLCAENFTVAGDLLSLIKSAQHRKNLLGPYREVGFGFSQMSNGKWILVQHLKGKRFGAKRDLAETKQSNEVDENFAEYYEPNTESFWKKRLKACLKDGTISVDYKRMEDLEAIHKHGDEALVRFGMFQSALYSAAKVRLLHKGLRGDEDLLQFPEYEVEVGGKLVVGDDGKPARYMYRADGALFEEKGGKRLRFEDFLKKLKKSSTGVVEDVTDVDEKAKGAEDKTKAVAVTDKRGVTDEADGSGDSKADEH